MKKSIQSLQLVILLTTAVFSLSSSFAQDNGGGNGSDRITICHATGSASNPYNEITISVNGLNGHEGHEGDIIPAPLEGCPLVEVTVEASAEVTAEATDEAESIGDRITICHATGSASNPYNEITISVNGLNGHEGHEGDIIPAPEGGCGTEDILATAIPVSSCNVLPNDANNFPRVDADNCAPDTSVLERPQWQAISLSPAVCLDWLVYHSNQTGDWELFRLDIVATDANLNLSRGIGASDISPSRSPDAQWITFMSNRDGNWEIYISAVEGDNIQRLSYNTTAIERDPVWSPTGGQIVYESNRDGNWDLYLFDINTGREERITNNAGNDVNAFWSQDSTKLLFQSDRDGIWQIYEKTINTNDDIRLSDGAGNDLAPQYVYNGIGIVFRSFREGNNSVIYWMNTDGSNVQSISDRAGSASNHAVSPQGTFIAYTSNLDGDNDIYVYEFATGLSRKLTDNTVNDYAATWYCGEPTVSFDSDVTGNPDLFSASVLPMDAPAIVVEAQANQLTNLTSQELYPMMSPSEENASGIESFPAVTN